MIKAVLPVALATLGSATMARADVLAVAVDIAPVHSLVARVMGELGTPTLIVSPGASPHGDSLRPSQAQALQNADVVFWVSAELTPWLAESIDTLAPDAMRVELLEVPGITELAQRQGALFEAHDHKEYETGHADVAHSEHGERGQAGDEHEAEATDLDDHDHGARDAHAWLDPSNAAIWLDTIADELSKADPPNANTYSANAASGKAELATLTTDVERIIAPVRDRRFIVFHDAYQYFENAFDFPASGAIALSDASRPGPARIQQIHERVADANVTCVLTEPQFNPMLVATVLDGTDAKSSAIDPLGSHLPTGPTLYPQLLRDLARSLADCL